MGTPFWVPSLSRGRPGYEYIQIRDKYASKSYLFFDYFLNKKYVKKRVKIRQKKKSNTLLGYKTWSRKVRGKIRYHLTYSENCVRHAATPTASPPLPALHRRRSVLSPLLHFRGLPSHGSMASLSFFFGFLLDSTSRAFFGSLRLFGSSKYIMRKLNSWAFGLLG